MIFPSSENTAILHKKSWRVETLQNHPVSRLFNKRLSLEGHTSELKSEPGEQLKTKVGLSSQCHYDRATLIAEQLKIIEKTDPSLNKFAGFLAKQKRGLQKLGMLLWVYENCQKDKKFSEEWLEKTFMDATELIEDELYETIGRNKFVDIQPPNLIKNTLIPREIAKHIITKNGFINIGLIAYIKEKIEKDQTNPLNHDVSLHQTLDLFLSSESLRDQLSRFHAPQIPLSPGATVIRASLGLSNSDTLTKVHAMRAAAQALLSHMRQQEKRSCFAAFLAINTKQSRLSRCLEDFMSILQYSHLTREDKNTTRHFPFLLKMSNLDLNNEVMIDKDGKIISETSDQGFLWDSTGLTAACTIMGIDDPRGALLSIAKELENPATPKKIIEKLASNAVPKDDQKMMRAKLYQQACFAFGAATYNPLLKVWVNAIAGMAESEANGFFSSCLIKTLLKVFHQVLVEKKLPLTSLERFERDFYHRLSNAVQLIYDPSIGTPDNGTEGGFVLYEAIEEGDIRRLKRIDNVQCFIDFVKRLLKQCSDIPELLPFYADSPAFIETILATYNNILSRHLDKGSQKTYSTPWINHLGHDASDIIGIYLNDASELKILKLSPSNGKRLLRKLIVMGKRLDKQEKDKLKTHPYLLKPARIVGYHAFSLMIGHKTLQQAWRDKRSSRKWVEEGMLAPGLEVSNSTITQAQRERLMKAFQVEGIAENLTIKQFRKALLKKYPNSLLIDQKLYETLPSELKQKLPVIHFADTNLHSGASDVHFCFIVNPGSGKIEVWQATDDDTKLAPLDQHEVVNHRQWEIYLYPDELIC